MNIVFIIVFIFFLIGTCFGSFSTVLIERWHKKKGGILFGRSECPSCNHILGASELIPILSYASQGGRCKNCKKKISAFYPMSELFMGLLFAIMSWIALSFGYFPTEIMWWVFIVWGFITGVYILYDFRYMEIPDQVLVPGIYGTILILLGGIYFEEFRFIFDIGTYDTFHTFITDHISAAIILYTFLYFQILIPGGLYLLKNRKIKEFISLLMSYFLFPFILLVEFFGKKSQTPEGEIPAWVGGGDLRVALFIGLTLGSIHGIASFFFAYILGSIFGIFVLLKKGRSKELSKNQIPFGPFLGIGWVISLLFYNEIINFLHI